MTRSSLESAMRVPEASELASRVLTEVERAVVGKRMPLTLVLAAVLASLLAAWRLARDIDARWAWASVVLTGACTTAFMGYEHLRPELFGLPFLLWGVSALRRGRDGPAGAHGRAPGRILRTRGGGRRRR